MKITIGEKDYDIQIIKKSHKHVHFLLEGEEFFASLKDNDQENLTIDLNGNRNNVFITNFENKGVKQVFSNGNEEYLKIHSKVSGNSTKGAGAGSLESPMPGKIFKILKSQGEEVAAGDTILIMEAMKMEHAIKATKDGVVKEIFFKEGEQVAGGAELCAIE